MNQKNLKADLPVHHMQTTIVVSKAEPNRLEVSFHYNPVFVARIKAIAGHRWHPDGKYWSFPNTNGALAKILNVFEGEKIHLDPALQVKLNVPFISHCEAKPKQSQFEDLRRELLSRKYSKVEKGVSPYEK